MSIAIAADQRVQVRICTTFSDPGLGPDLWRMVASRADTWTVFQELDWQQAWWESFGRGELLIAVASVSGQPLAVAPLFVDGGMAFFVGSGGSDYLDFIGAAHALDVMSALLAAVLARVPNLIGFRFYHVPAASRTVQILSAVAAQLGLTCHDEGGLSAPALDLGADGSAGLAAAGRTSLLRHERYFQRSGGLVVRHLRSGEEILPHLEAFFAQHQARWRGTSSPSLFHDPAQQAFYRRLAWAAPCWLRFTMLEWCARPIAFHFGFSHRGSYLWYKPSFDIELARRSPGEALLRCLLLAAVEEGAHTFDFGLGDEAFKHRFASCVPCVHTFGLYRSA